MINFYYFSSKPYAVTPHLSRLDEMVQMRGHSICFYAELTKTILNYHKIRPLISSSVPYPFGQNVTASGTQTPNPVIQNQGFQPCRHLLRMSEKPSLCT